MLRLATSLLITTLVTCAITPALAQRACAGPQVLRGGWSISFAAPCTDHNGRLAAGSQVIHLVSHKGRLYAANGYWKDDRNVWYGGPNANTGWGQVLALAGPSEPWTVDLELGPQHLRTELLKSLTFTQDSAGRLLPAPETFLIAATYDVPSARGVSLFVRDDQIGGWTASKIVAGNTGKKGEDNSVRAAAVHRDRVTGRERLFLSIGVLGVYTASYDPAKRGRFAWSREPEFGPTRTRTLSLVEADGSLFASEGTRIFQRIDGQSPRWVTVADLSREADSSTSRATFQSIGGIRGLSAIAGPVPGRQSLIFVWTAGRTSRACVFRLDPLPDGSWSRERETCFADLIGQHLDGAPIGYALGAYSEIMPLSDPATGAPLHLVGLEAFIVDTGAGRALQPLTARNQRTSKGGFYAGAMYGLRDASGHWRIAEIDGALVEQREAAPTRAARGFEPADRLGAAGQHDIAKGEEQRRDGAEPQPEQQADAQLAGKGGGDAHQRQRQPGGPAGRHPFQVPRPRPLQPQQGGGGQQQSFGARGQAGDRQARVHG